ncbi:hypothetical protein K443DRAFT_274376 [Laccaria amethystina LaAM-08-1]|uniref:Uncharacterized protein n=1 Tax=Laccaria amethystina LaAM-08-1 TaxID=1095629 RepID=A0A0C9XGC8_9AGAR|nr:hypothetical protein K443DRAFT_274376 [Laccaria amethystina LaAM-08-1]
MQFCLQNTIECTYVRFVDDLDESMNSGEEYFLLQIRSSAHSQYQGFCVAQSFSWPPISPERFFTITPVQVRIISTFRRFHEFDPPHSYSGSEGKCNLCTPSASNRDTIQRISPSKPHNPV